METVQNVSESTLPLMEAFYTIQGEGYHSGKAAYFIRLGGCDVGCVWCDVKESWDADQFPKVEVNKIINEALKYPSRLAVVTGGEPLMYDCSILTSELKKAGFQTNIETSGAYPVTGEWDWICFSPKKFKKPVDSIYTKADELKVIIYNKSDFDWAEEFSKKVNKTCKLLLQPEWDKSERMMASIVKYVKENPKWGISLQTHKFMHIP